MLVTRDWGKKEVAGKHAKLHKKQLCMIPKQIRLYWLNEKLRHAADLKIQISFRVGERLSLIHI